MNCLRADLCLLIHREKKLSITVRLFLSNFKRNCRRYWQKRELHTRYHNLKSRSKTKLIQTEFEWSIQLLKQDYQNLFWTSVQEEDIDRSWICRIKQVCKLQPLWKLERGRKVGRGKAIIQRITWQVTKPGTICIMSWGCQWYECGSMNSAVNPTIRWACLYSYNTHYCEQSRLKCVDT
jgi:hypothetical protein